MSQLKLPALRTDWESPHSYTTTRVPLHIANAALAEWDRKNIFISHGLKTITIRNIVCPSFSPSFRPSATRELESIFDAAVGWFVCVWKGKGLVCYLLFWLHRRAGWPVDKFLKRLCEEELSKRFWKWKCVLHFLHNSTQSLTERDKKSSKPWVFIFIPLLAIDL